MNTTVIVGNLTRDPEIRFLATGKAVASFGVAVNRRWQKDGEWQEETGFFNVTAWGPLGENCAESLSKGKRVVVAGRLEQQSWEDKETGEKRSKVEIVASDVGISLMFGPEQSSGGTRYDNEEPF